MAKIVTMIGFATMVETSPGVYNERVEERRYKGDLLSATRRLVDTPSVNQELSANLRIEVPLDDYLAENLFNVRYAYWRGAKWRVSSIEERYPRGILNLGGLWNAIA